MMATIETARGKISYVDHRDANATTPPLVLIHGAGGSRLDWSVQVRKLNSLALDLPGHGKSALNTPEDRRETVGAYAEDVRAFMAALGLDRAVMVGHSMGGAVALTLALTAPQQVASLILIGTGAKLKVSEAILHHIQTDQATVGKWLKTTMWGAETPHTLRELSFTEFMKRDSHVIYGDYLACNDFDARERLHEITMPSLVIGGTEDQMTPFKYSEYLAQHLPNAQLVKIENAGHMMALEQPDAVVTAIKSALTGHLSH